MPPPQGSFAGEFYIRFLYTSKRPAGLDSGSRQSPGNSISLSSQVKLFTLGQIPSLLARVYFPMCVGVLDHLFSLQGEKVCVWNLVWARRCDFLLSSQPKLFFKSSDWTSLKLASQEDFLSSQIYPQPPAHLREVKVSLGRIHKFRARSSRIVLRYVGPVQADSAKLCLVVLMRPRILCKNFLRKGL